MKDKNDKFDYPMKSEDASDREGSSVDVSYVRLVKSIFLQAIKENASEIYIEPREKHIWIGYRIGNTICDKKKILRRLIHGISRRIKAMGGMDVFESRQSQEGSIFVRTKDKKYNLIVNTLPTEFGEKITIRIS